MKRIIAYIANEINNLYQIYLMTKSEEWHKKRHEKKH